MITDTVTTNMCVVWDWMSHWCKKLTIIIIIYCTLIALCYQSHKISQNLTKSCFLSHKQVCVITYQDLFLSSCLCGKNRHPEIMQSLKLDLFFFNSDSVYCLLELLWQCFIMLPPIYLFPSLDQQWKCCLKL